MLTPIALIGPLLCIPALCPAESGLTDPAAEDAGLEEAAAAWAEESGQRLATAIAETDEVLVRAGSLDKQGAGEDALKLLDVQLRALPASPLTVEARLRVRKARAAILLGLTEKALAARQPAEARRRLEEFRENGLADVRAERILVKLESAELDPPSPPVGEVSADYIAARKVAAQWMARARTQYGAGDLDGAESSYRQAESLASDDTEPKQMLRRIASDRERLGPFNRERSRTTMLQEVAHAWERPAAHAEAPVTARRSERDAEPLVRKLSEIQVPHLSFNGADLAKVVATLTAISEEYDRTGSQGRGVNFVLLDPSARNPPVNLTLRNLSLGRILDFITDSVGYRYEVLPDAVVIRPGGETTALDTAFFPVSRATVIRMTGPALSAPPSVPSSDPFSGSVASAGAPGSEAQALRGFLQQAGVNFDGTSGASLAYDGSAMIVTQTARNLERIRTILNRYNDVRQVEIEAKFIEVQEGALEELGVSWNVTRRGRRLLDPLTGDPLVDATGAPRHEVRDRYTSGGIRPLADAFRNSNSVNAILIDGEAAATTAPPTFPGAVLMGGTGSPLADLSGAVGDFDVQAVIRALSQKQGTDLLSAPKVTVLSGNTATMVVAQEMRYPQSYGEIQSQVGSSNSSGTSGSAGVTVTAGTPQDFATRNVGVELRVTPIVEEDDYSISLDLNPKVTEFEGFVEYGGPSLAISSGRTVTVPPGFYQPIFSVREVTTKVTLWDGATLIMGGLTREEVKQVNDRIPVLGSIPGLGRLFRSKGETAQKRNLLIFVTANLVSPGGSPKKLPLQGAPASTPFRNPTWVTPAGPAARERDPFAPLPP